MRNNLCSCFTSPESVNNLIANVCSRSTFVKISKFPDISQIVTFCQKIQEKSINLFQCLEPLLATPKIGRMTNVLLLSAVVKETTALLYPIIHCFYMHLNFFLYIYTLCASSFCRGLKRVSYSFKMMVFYSVVTCFLHPSLLNNWRKASVLMFDRV